MSISTVISRFGKTLRNIPSNRPPWLWLLVGFLLLPFTAWQTVIPLAAWLAPVFLLRFVRTSGKNALRLLFLAYVGGFLIAIGGMLGGNMQLNIALLLLIPLFRGMMYTMPYRADRLIGSRLGAWERLFIFPLAYTAVEWVMSLLPPITAAGSLAYSQYDNLALMQIVSITGMWGLTFLIAWFASTVNILWEHHFDWRPVRSMVGLFVGVMLAAFLFGSVRLSFATPSSQTVEAATITLDNAIYKEANDAIDWMTFYQSTDQERAAVRPKFQAAIDQMLTRTEIALRGGAKIVGWQEEAALVLEEDKSSVLDRVSALAKQYDAYLQVSLAVFTRAEKLPYVRNQSILIDPAGKVVWTYDKTRPVVGEDFINIAGTGQLPIANTPYGRLSTAICNDMNFPALIRQAGQNGVDILFTPYNDSSGFAATDAVTADYRAIENGVSLVRATAGGISTIADNEGRIVGSQDYFTDNSGIMMTTIPTHGVTTVYSRIGDIFAYLCVAGLLLLAALAYLRRKQPAAVSQRQPA